jgi:hypothetical protein
VTYYTSQDMLDNAMEEGAWHATIGHNEWVKVTDEGHWFHMHDGVEDEISYERALELLPLQDEHAR